MTLEPELPLFPLEVTDFVPSPWPSADLKELARTSDGHEFAAKWEHEGAGLPASEWLGHRLAQACQIATPFTVTLHHNGKQGFGSRIEGDVSSWNTLAPPERANVIAQCSQSMCGLLALDLFVGNEDRHLNNWLFRRNLSGQWVPLCIDFSRALFRRGFPADPWPLPQCNTLSTIGILKAVGRWDGSSAIFAVEHLQRVTAGVVKHWLQECPLPWLPEPNRSALTSWWASSAYHDRLQGTYALL
jgi:hypothetical protein